ncbi:MAG: Uma2 family endonuclease [Gemmataceae bacterium]
MSRSSQARATLDDLYQTTAKAELIGGRIVEFMPTGYKPNKVAANIHDSLRAYCKQKRRGEALTDNMGYAVPELASGRESFSPDASYYAGPLPANLMRFIEGPPTLAVEVCSENDYGDAAEEEMSAKRADYFEAGTLVVWDVDSLAELVHVYRADDPDQPATFQRGQAADGEPAVPGWKMAVEDVFSLTS